MRAVVLCRNRVGFSSNPLIRRIRVGDVQEYHIQKLERCQIFKKECSSRRRPGSASGVDTGLRRDDIQMARFAVIS
jgi:hypothetical protein